MTIDTQKMKKQMKARLAELQAQTRFENATGMTEDEKALEYEEAASDMVAEEMKQALTSEEAGVIKEIRDALKRIEEGSYGFCVQCGQPIPEKRLEAIPWAAYCIKDEERREKAQGLDH